MSNRMENLDPGNAPEAPPADVETGELSEEDLELVAGGAEEPEIAL